MSYWLLFGTAITAAVPATANDTITTMPVVRIPPPPAIYSAPSGPEPGKQSVAIPRDNPGAWATTSDYPRSALIERREGTSGFRLAIDVTGRATACSITESSGHADLDKATCDNMVRRARFFPAQDGKGRLIEGSWSSRVRWQIPEILSSASQTISDRSFPRPPKVADYRFLQIKAADYPADALADGFEGQSEVSLSISSNGVVKGCTISKSSGHTSLDQKSCVLASIWKFAPAADREGVAVEGVSAHSFDWRLPKGSIGKSQIITTSNPFEKPGSVAFTLDFDREGKLSNCQAEFVGEYGLLPRGALNPEHLCKNPPTNRIKPFTGKDGQSEPRRVILKMEIAHQELPAQTATTVSK